MQYDFNVAAGDAFYNSNSATINANDFNVTAARYFYNYETINANNFNVTAGYDFNNYETINADNFNVTTGTFSNSLATQRLMRITSMFQQQTTFSIMQ